jgi:hypothetical protein
MNRDDFRRLAEIRLEDARVLEKSARVDHGYIYFSDPEATPQGLERGGARD